MAIYITGDTHGDFQRFGSKYFPQQKEMSRGDYVVIAGDFGGLWDGSQKDQYWLDWLNKKPFTTLFVDGNHENFDLLNTLPEKEWNGGRVHVVREHVLHLMRGQVFDFGGLAWFTMGGAASHDIQDGILDPAAPDFERQYWLMRRMRSMFRVKGVSWWEEEMPSLEEYRASHKANIACKEAIEQAIADNYRDNRLGPACVQQVLQQFDPGRIFYVLANTVRQKEHDGRISRDNKAWAQTIPVCEDKDGFGYDRNVSFVVDRSHPGLMDLFLTQARDIAKEDFKMNQEFTSRNQVEFIRQTYPPNTRILLQHMDDPYAPVPAGTRGTVKYVDDIGQIGVAWDNGRSLSLIPGMDTYRKLTQQELTQEQGEKPSIHDSLGKHAGQQAAHSDKPKMKKEQTR